MKYLLDTHTWIWWNMNPQKISSRITKLILGREYKVLLLSAISVWEFCKLIEKERLAISLSPLEWLNIALDMSGLELVPLTPLISYKSTALEKPFHNDPADQIIVATAMVENAIIVTADKRIQDYPHIRTIW
jgi:PIN domain nuclease of toxin-antitoxin system